MRLSISVDVEKDLGDKKSFFGIDEGLPFILDTLNKYNIKGTFFINGESLEYISKNGFLEEIIKNQHEIASHGLRHVDYRMLPKNEVLYELKKSKEALEKLSNKEVLGYRSPQFRINAQIISILEDVGYSYDSSIPKPGCFSAAKLLRNVKFNSKEIDQINAYINEFYITCIPILKIPYGLLWLTKINFSLYKTLFNFNNKENLIVFYIHPFDLVENKSNMYYNSLMQKYFYKINLIKPKRLFERLIEFWKQKGIIFRPLKDCLK